MVDGRFCAEAEFSAMIIGSETVVINGKSRFGIFRAMLGHVLIMSTEIHSTAIIDPKALLGEGVRIGSALGC